MAVLSDALEQQGFKRSIGNIKVKIGPHFKDLDGINSINYRLSHTCQYKFVSIFGEIYSIGNVMAYLRYEGAKPAWITSHINKKDYDTTRKFSNKRNVPNYWNIISLIIVDRLLADKQLIDDINAKFPNEDIYAIRLIPTTIVRRGLIEEEANNEKLRTYGIITGINVRDIIIEFRNTFGNNAKATELDKDKFKEFKTKMKQIVIGRVMDHLKSDNLLDGVDSSVSNEAVIERFLK